MLSTLSVVLPIFAVIFAGWLARRLELLGPAATSELNRYVVYLALPALLFDVIAHAGGREIWRPGFIAAFGAFGFALLRTDGRHPASPGEPARRCPPSMGLNGAYANTGYMGFHLPWPRSAPGRRQPVLIATILTVCFVFALAIVLIEIGLQKSQTA